MINTDPKSYAEETWPNFFIVGAARAGTTALYEYLKRTPNVYLPDVKEPRYFLAKSEVEDIYGRLTIGNKQKYLDLFAGARATAIGEATPEYLYHETVATNIHSKVPSARIIITLRNPITRAFSHYLLLKKLLPFRYTFDELLLREIDLVRNGSHQRLFRSPSILECGFYYNGVKRYLDLFGSERVHIVIFEEWIKNEREAINAILNFLQVDYRFDNLPDIVRDNASRAYNNKLIALMNYKINNRFTTLAKVYHKLPDFAKSILKEFYYRQIAATGSEVAENISSMARELLFDKYREDVKHLEAILGRKLPWEDFSII